MASVTTGLEDLSGEWPMVRVLQRFASAQRALFESYQIDAVRPGESVDGGYQPSDSLAEVARKRAVDVAEMIEQIKKSQDITQRLEISVRETSQLMKEGKVALLDVRCAEAFAVASIPGSRLVDEPLAKEIVGSWPRETPIVLSAIMALGLRMRPISSGLWLRECEEPSRGHRRLVAGDRSGGAAILMQRGSPHGPAVRSAFSRTPAWMS